MRSPHTWLESATVVLSSEPFNPIPKGSCGLLQSPVSSENDREAMERRKSWRAQSRREGLSDVAADC